MNSEYSSQKHQEFPSSSNEDFQVTNQRANYPATKCVDGTNMNEASQPSKSSENGESMQTGSINKHYDANHLETMRQHTEVNLKSLEQDSSKPDNKEELHLRKNKKMPSQEEATYALIELNKNQDNIQKIAQVQEEYDVLKNFVDVRLKPLISRLKRMNAEKDLDLRASAKLIDELQREQREQRAPRSSPALEDADSMMDRLSRVQEEYDVLKNFVDVRLKPLISRLKRMNAEKDLDLRASAKLIDELQREQRAPRSSPALEDADGMMGRLSRVQEEYDLLKNFANVRLKPLISRLERMDAEKDLDLRASAKLIDELLSDKCVV